MARFAIPLARRRGHAPREADAADLFNRRALRAQAVQRLQVGLLGLGAMLLLVGLASVIRQNLHLGEDGAIAAQGPLTVHETARPSPGPNPARSPSDPLADIGAMPEIPAHTAAPNAAAHLAAPLPAASPAARPRVP